ncbi:unnamed protein product [Phytophthora lilii]|uniref:Unnamed protein product n=1 Tax=Phytophthora lilii TaxID=2077276 RepID=A0A9W6WFK6_9STRA|nr:unnamed protein product [Phytophthora lilii]
MKLSSMLKEQFRKSKQTELSPFQQVAVSVVAVAPTTFQQDESSIQNKYSGISKKSEVVSTSTNVLTPELSAPAPPVQPTDDARAQSNNQEMRSEQYDTLQRLIRNIDCEEQQKRVEKLQAELEKANARRRDAGFTPSKRTDDLSTSPACDYLEDSMSSPATVSPGSTVVRKAANKFMHVKPLESYHASRPSETDALSKSTNQPPETPQPSPLAQPASIPIVPSPAYPPQFVLPGYCQSHPVQIAPYPLFSPSTYPVNPYGFGFPSPYFGSCSYPTVLPWLSAGTPYPYQIGTTSPPEQLPKVEHHHQEEEIRRLERELEMQRAINDQQAEAKEFARLQGRLQELQVRGCVESRASCFEHDDIKAEGQRTDFQDDFMGSYNPDSGFTLFWDYAANVPAAVNDLQVRSSLAVASVSQSSGGGPRVPTSLGWTAFDIFKVASEGEFVLAGGFVKLPVKQSSMPDPSKVLVLPPTPGECGDIKVHIRLVHGERVEEASRVFVNPESHGARYQLPDIGKVSVQPQSRGMMARRPSIQGRKTPNDKLTKPLDDQKAASSFVRTERLLDPPRSAHSQKQDFLDVDRLRLLSAASSRPPTTRPRSNIPATSDRVRLPAFPEDNDEADEPWIRVDNTAELQRRLLAGNSFQPGDGFNVFVDGGRGFPDNATISKVTIAALHADRTQVLAENGSAFPPATSSAFDPVFEAYVEYRQGTFNPTLTLVIRVDTVELVSKQPVILGYSVFPVFLDAETREQPNRPSIPQFILNEGGFQLPLHTQVQSTESLSAKSCDGFPRIPCATVLLRIVRAKLVSRID